MYESPTLAFSVWSSRCGPDDIDRTGGDLECCCGEFTFETEIFVYSSRSFGCARGRSKGGAAQVCFERSDSSVGVCRPSSLRGYAFARGAVALARCHPRKVIPWCFCYPPRVCFFAPMGSKVVFPTCMERVWFTRFVSLFLSCISQQTNDIIHFLRYLEIGGRCDESGSVCYFSAPLSESTGLTCCKWMSAKRGRGCCGDSVFRAEFLCGNRDPCKQTLGGCYIEFTIRMAERR
ncbi:unnamed protein product, partial [Ectocarpus sp. 8 AP-2014]